MMKPLHLQLFLLLLAFFGSKGWAGDVDSLSTPVSQTKSLDQFPGIQLKKQISGNFDCPDNTVYSIPFDATAQQKTISRSDQCFSAGRSRIFMTFSSVKYAIDGIRVFGDFADGSFRYCDSRVPLAADGSMTKPIRLEVAIWANDNGKAGEQIYKEEFDVVGEKVGTGWDDGQYVYAFTMKFAKKLRVSNGFVSVAAVGDEKYDCCFMLVSHSNVPNGYLEYFPAGKDVPTYYNGSFCFCFTGDGNDPLVGKSLQLNKLINPKMIERGKHAKVQVEVENYGFQTLNDATLELYVDDKLMATEKINRTLDVGEIYKYNFQTRIDLSGEGYHKVDVKNVTPGETAHVGQTLSVTTENNGDVCTSQSYYKNEFKFIKRVTIGDIDNESGWSLYSDFRNQKTPIALGDTLKLKVDYQANNGDFFKVYVDWNGNGLFEDDGEFMGYISKDSTYITVPKGIDARPGDKCMRLLLSQGDVPPYGVYTFGETEDYTLTLVKTGDNPAAALSEESFDDTLPAEGTSTLTEEIENQGDKDLSASFSLSYQLPNSPESTTTTPGAVVSNPDGAPKLLVAPLTKTKASEPAQEENTKYVLSYGKGYSGGIGTASTFVDYAHYYPAEMLSAIKGMTISSVDVYLETAPRKSFVTVRGQYKQQIAGNEILKQQFTPMANSWNHIVLDKPVEIGSQDLWVGVSLEGVKNIASQIGVDSQPAVAGYGDLISTDNNNYWWSLADLGTNHNLLIRANVTGTPTPAINWLALDKSNIALAAGGKDNVTLNVNAKGLTDGVYEATLVVNTNDPLRSVVKVPVAVQVGDPSGISTTSTQSAPLQLLQKGHMLEVATSETVKTVALYATDGRLLARVNGTKHLFVGALPTGMYHVNVTLSNGRLQNASIILKK